MAAAKSPHVSQKIFSKRRLDWFLSIFLYLVNHRLVAESTKTHRLISKIELLKTCSEAPLAQRAADR